MVFLSIYSLCFITYFFNRILEYLDLEIGISDTSNQKVEILQNNIEENSKQELLEKLCPVYKNRKELETILDEIDEHYHIEACSKLDKVAIILLLREHCNFLNQNIAKKFNQLRKLVLQYYGFRMCHIKKMIVRKRG